MVVVLVVLEGQIAIVGLEEVGTGMEVVLAAGEV